MKQKYVLRVPVASLSGLLCDAIALEASSAFPLGLQLGFRNSRAFVLNGWDMAK